MQGPLDRVLKVASRTSQASVEHHLCRHFMLLGAAGLAGADWLCEVGSVAAVCIFKRLQLLHAGMEEMRSQQAVASKPASQTNSVCKRWKHLDRERSCCRTTPLSDPPAWQTLS